MTRATALVLFALPFPACSGGSKLVPFPSSPRGYQYARATQDCAPWDGPAVTIYLMTAAGDSVPPTGRHLQISLFIALDHLPGQRLSWPDDTRKGNLFECGSIESCRPIPEGRVRISKVSKDNTVWGEVHLLTAAGDTIQGGFRARWRPRRIFCG